MVSLATDEDIQFATILNRNYFRLVWGIMDDATNSTIQPDERAVLDAVFNNNSQAEHVLEVGCGSGRLTNYLAGLTTV
jgi:cyclopropane fatty-acyl-phospholipid synthase-like methyltransferase